MVFLFVSFTFKDPNGNSISAPEYISRILHWISVQLNDPSVFPPVDFVPPSCSVAVDGGESVTMDIPDDKLGERSSSNNSSAMNSSVDGGDSASQLHETPYVQNFEEKVQAIMRFIMRIYGHLYHSHAPDFIALGTYCVLCTCALS